MKARFVRLLFLVCAINCIALLGWSAVCPRPTPIQLHEPHRLLIFAAHQDDDVIQAGGLGIQNARLGGTTRIVFLTEDADPNMRPIRRNEVRRAWSLVGDSNLEISYLPYISKKTEWPADDRTAALSAIEKEIRLFAPTLINAPLSEGGHPEHDLLSKLVERASQPSSVQVLYSAEYNPVYIASTNPVKLLWFLVRLGPFLPYKEPNFGLHPNLQKVLRMDSQQIATKNSMLQMFDSQRDIIPISQFGYPDLFDVPGQAIGVTFDVGAKRFSPWAAASVALVISALCCWGFIVGKSVSSKVSAAILCLICVPALFAFFFAPTLLKEEFLLLLDFATGFGLATLSSFLDRFNRTALN